MGKQKLKNKKGSWGERVCEDRPMEVPVLNSLLKIRTFLLQSTPEKSILVFEDPSVLGDECLPWQSEINNPWARQ